jgi:hypothetical protein
MVFNNDFERECIETGRDIPKRDIQEMMIEVCFFIHALCYNHAKLRHRNSRTNVTFEYPLHSHPLPWQEMRYFRPSKESLAKMSEDSNMVYDDRK